MIRSWGVFGNPLFLMFAPLVGGVILEWNVTGTEDVILELPDVRTCVDQFTNVSGPFTVDISAVKNGGALFMRTQVLNTLASLQGQGGRNVTYTANTLAILKNSLLGITFKSPLNEYNSDVVLIKVKDATVALIELSITPVNDAPLVVSLDSSYAAVEDTSFVISGLSVQDVDVGSGYMTAQIRVQHGTITLRPNVSKTISITGLSGDNSSVVTFSTNLTNVNKLIAGMIYLPAKDYYGTDRFTLSVSDNGGWPAPNLTSNITIPITITAANDAPVLTIPSTFAVYARSFGSVEGISLADIDCAGNACNSSSIAFTVNISAVQGKMELLIDNAAATKNAVKITGGINTPSETITLRGSLAGINWALGSLRYYSPYWPGSGLDTITVFYSDNGNIGVGGPLPVGFINNVIMVDIITPTESPTPSPSPPPTKTRTSSVTPPPTMTYITPPYTPTPTDTATAIPTATHTGTPSPIPTMTYLTPPYTPTTTGTQSKTIAPPTMTYVTPPYTPTTTETDTPKPTLLPVYLEVQLSPLAQPMSGPKFVLTLSKAVGLPVNVLGHVPLRASPDVPPPPSPGVVGLTCTIAAQCNGHASSVEKNTAGTQCICKCLANFTTTGSSTTNQCNACSPGYTNYPSCIAGGQVSTGRQLRQTATGTRYGFHVYSTRGTRFPDSEEGLLQIATMLLGMVGNASASIAPLQILWLRAPFEATLGAGVPVYWNSHGQVLPPVPVFGGYAAEPDGGSDENLYALFLLVLIIPIVWLLWWIAYHRPILGKVTVDDEDDDENPNGDAHPQSASAGVPAAGSRPPIGAAPVPHVSTLQQPSSHPQQQQHSNYPQHPSNYPTPNGETAGRPAPARPKQAADIPPPEDYIHPPTNPHGSLNPLDVRANHQSQQSQQLSLMHQQQQAALIGGGGGTVPESDPMDHIRGSDPYAGYNNYGGPHSNRRASGPTPA